MLSQPNKLYPAITVYRRWPKNIQENDKNLFSHEIQKTIPETYYEIIRNSTFSYSGYFKISSFKPIHSFSFNTFPSWKERLKMEIKFSFFPHITKKLSTRALTICDNFSNGYFHWFCDALPRLYVVQEHQIPFDTLLLPAYYQNEAYILPSLQPFFIPSIYQIREKEYLKIKELLTISALAPTGNYRPSIMQALRNRYRNYFGLTTREATQKIYISRIKAARRKVMNEKALLPLLERYGYQVVCMEDLSFEDQVRTVGNAKVLISIHGAGLTNMLFMAPGSKVVEFRFPADSHNNCYFSLASALDLDYYYLLGQPSEQSKNPHVDNIEITPFLLESILQELES